MTSAPDSTAVGVAIATRDRRALLLDTLGCLRALPERPPVVVADDGSRDGTAAAVRARAAADPGVAVVALERPAGAAARTAAIERLTTPYVALSDDDSWWDPGALSLAAALLERHPRLGLVAATVVVGPDRRLDPTCAAMAGGPLAAAAAAAPARAGDDLPGVPVLGFVACGAVVRRDAYLAVGGFHPRFGVGGEERLLALDLRAAGWAVRHVPAVVAHHCPPPSGRRRRRRARTVRNDLWTIWLRRPARRVPPATAGCLRAAGLAPATVAGATAALTGLPWLLRTRRPLPAAVEREARRLETNGPPVGVGAPAVGSPEPTEGAQPCRSRQTQEGTSGSRSRRGPGQAGRSSPSSARSTSRPSGSWSAR
jgi:GT2 family glycosyltransferase